MARRSQCSAAEDNPLDPNYLPRHYREEYRLAIDALVEHDLEGYYEFLQSEDVVDFLCRPEIEHIQNNVQGPRHMDRPGAVCQGDEASEGSSDTYWPMHSDLDAPSLDLGWPEQLPFVGPTEIITFVNPPDPVMPSIKTQARRLIKDAQLVIAIAMDIFTDIDIFADLLEATKRNVAVYILLDEQNAHLFKAMVVNCGVNLDQIKPMRVRTVAGINYYCRSGKSLKGQMMERYMLIDSRAVLGGNYSYMWSYEKLHRCLAHLFLGQLVSTFDEEFRILYAQSEPLVVENAIVPVQKYSSMPELQRQYKGYPRKPQEHAAGEGMHNAELFPLRRGQSAQLLPSQLNMPPTQQYRPDRPGAFGANLIRRSSYGDGTPGGYYQQYLMHRQKQSMDALETQSTHSHRDQHHFDRTGRDPIYDPSDKFRIQRYQHSDQYSEPGGQPAMDQVDNYDHVLKFLQSNPPVGMGHGSENLMVPEGPYSMSGRSRQRFNQPYVCQTSPTQLSPHEQKQFHMESAPERKPRDPVAKKGLRDWRIHSYLSAYDDTASEDTAPLQGSDIGDDSPFSSQERLCDLDPLAPRVGLRELPKMPSAGLYSFQKKAFQADDMKSHPSVQAGATESEKAEDVETDATKDEAVRKRPNPTLHRSSRLRNSLLFGSSLEQHRSLYDMAKPQEESSKTVEKNAEGKNPLKKQSTVPAEEPKPVDLPPSHLQRSSSFILDMNVDMNDPDNRLEFFKQLAAQRKAEVATKSVEGMAKKPSKETDVTVTSASDGSHSAVKQGQTSEVTHKSAKADLQSPKATKDKIPIITVHVSDSDTKLVESLSPTGSIPPEGATLHQKLPQIATDAEKIELKRLQEPAAAKHALHPNSSTSSSIQQSDSQKEKSLDAPHDSGKRELPVMPPAIISESPPSNKPVLPVISGEAASDKTTSVETTDHLNTATSEKTAEVASVGTKESGETKEELVKKRPKPNLQRASKLRNSLLFSSNIEQHQSQWGKDSGGQDSLSSGLSNLSQDSVKSDSTPGIDLASTSFKRQASFTMGEQSNPGEFQAKVLQRTTAMLNLTDPDSRLQFFRELAAQRKNGRTGANSAESTTGQKPKPDEETEENVPVPEQSTQNPLSNPLTNRQSNADAPQVLDDDTKTLKGKNAPESHAAKDLADNSVQCHSSKSGFAQTATDSEKMEHMKLNVKGSTKLQCATSTSSAGIDSSSAIKDIPRKVNTSNENQTSKKQISTSDVSTKQVPAVQSSSLSPGKGPRSSTSHPVIPISIVGDTQEDICSNNSNKTLDSDASSVCSSIEMGSGTDHFSTAPSSPCTPTPTEYCPVQREKISVVSPVAETPVPSTSSSAKTCTPLKISSANTTSELEKCSSTSHALKTKPCASSPAKSHLVTEPNLTEHNLPPVSSTGHTSQPALPTPNNSMESTTTDASLSPISSPTKTKLTAVVSQSKSKLPQAGDSAETSPVASTQGSTKTKQKQKQNNKSKNKSKLSLQKSTSKELAPTTESTLSLKTKITDTSSASSSVKTEEVLDASAFPATNIVTSLTTADSSLSPASSTAMTDPMTNVAPTENTSSPETKISKASSSNSPTKNIPAVEVCIGDSKSSDDLAKRKGNLTLTISQSEGCSSPMTDSTIPKEAELQSESSSQLPSTSSPSKTVSSVGSPTKKPSKPQSATSPTNTCSVRPIKLTSPNEVKKLVSSPLLQLIQTDSSHLPTAATDSLAKPTASSPSDTASQGPEELSSPSPGGVLRDVGNSEISQAESALPKEESAETASRCDETVTEVPLRSDAENMPENCPQENVKLSEESAADETGTTTSRDTKDAVTLSTVEDSKEQISQSTEDAVILPSEDASKEQTSESTKEAVTLPSVEDSKVQSFKSTEDDVALPSVEDLKEQEPQSPKDSMTLAGTEDTKEQNSQSTEDGVTSPSAEDSKEQKSPTAEPTKSPSRYQSSTANVLSCSNLRDDTKVLLEQISANSQSRAAKQTTPDTDDAKKDEVTGTNEKGKRNFTSRFQSRTSQMSDKERDRLITAMESKRKERRVYSRFEAL